MRKSFFSENGDRSQRSVEAGSLSIFKIEVDRFSSVRAFKGYGEKFCKGCAQLEETFPSQHTCPEHRKKMERFCVTDCEVICLDCRDSRKHLHHDVLNIQEAAEEFKTQLQKSVIKLQTLIEKRNVAKRKFEGLLEDTL
eukprot:g38372.t1